MKKIFILLCVLLSAITINAQGKWTFYIGGATSKLYNKTPEYYNAWHNLATNDHEKIVFWGKYLNNIAAINNYVAGSTYRIITREKWRLYSDFGFTSMRYTEHADGGKSENYPFCFYCPNPAGDTLAITQKNVYRYFFAGPKVEYYPGKDFFYLTFSLIANYTNASSKFKLINPESNGTAYGRQRMYLGYSEKYADYKKIMISGKLGVGFVIDKRLKLEAEYYHSLTPINSFSTLSRLYFGGVASTLHYVLKR
jgi:hypothetical protein